MMEEKQLDLLVEKVLIDRCESNTLELKKAKTDCPKKIYDTLSSFSNQDAGGIILFGIDEEHDYEITGVDDPQKLQKSINEKCKEMEPVVRPFITRTKIKDKMVVAAEIPPVEFSLRPVFYKQKGRLKRSYIRVGDSDEPMSEVEIYGYEAFKKNLLDDLYSPGETLLYPDSQLLNKFIEQYRRNKPNTSSVFTDVDILNFSGICLNGRPTLAGTLVFSKAPQIMFPEYSIICLVVPGNELGDSDQEGTRFIENRRLDGPVMVILREAVEFVRRNSRTKNVIDEDGIRSDIPEYPIKAVREIILNAILHRDYGPYTRESPITVTLFDNRLEVSSPGGLFGNNTVEQLGSKRIETRNGRLVRILEDLGVTEHRFSGIPTIRKECSKFGLQEPEFISRHGEFTVVLRTEQRLDARSSVVQRKLEGFPVDTHKPENQEITEDNILVFCEEPRSRSEISDYFGLKWDTINKSYIRKLLKDRRLFMTLPNTPKSTKQRYTTKKN